MEKRRYEVLDALRGLCAVAVVALHYFESYRCDAIPHAHLAVEYFFFLTGFTFVLAYDGAWAGGLTLGRFLWRRFVRLWPLVLIGSFIGLLFCFALPGRFAPGMPDSPPVEILRFLYSVTMLPWTGRGFMAQMQPQTWTLLYIVYANVIYAFVLRHLKNGLLCLAVAAAAAFSCYVAVHYRSFVAGWDFSPDHIIVASARMAFPVLAGMLLARFGWKIGFRGAGLVSTALLAFFLLAPVCPTAGAAFGRYELAVVLVGLPLVVLTGAGGSIPEGRFARFCRFAGRFSFPLYATHFPLRIVLWLWVDGHPDATPARHAAVVFSIVVATLALAWVAMCAAEKLTERLSRLQR